MKVCESVTLPGDAQRWARMFQWNEAMHLADAQAYERCITLGKTPTPMMEALKAIREHRDKGTSDG